jgi:hypothetical protein
MRKLRYAPAIVILLALGSVVLAKVDILGYWWENPIDFQETPPGLASIRAADCGVCHQEIYREWRLSTHAHALSDQQYQAELHKSPETNWLCLNCHTPLVNQRAEYAVAVNNKSTHEPVMESNPRYDAALEEEAITCAVCHVRDGVILGPYGDTSAPHPVRHEPKLLTEEACTGCHQATAAYTDTLVCTFDTGAEWSASPYAETGQPCSHCHMPEVERSIVPGSPVRKSRYHYFVGSMIPKEVLGSLNGFPLNPRYLFRSGLEVDVVSVAAASGGVEVTLRLKNAYAGHLLPTGDPERFIRVEVRLSAGGEEFGPESLRIGQEWKWHPVAEKISDNRLKPLEERLETVRFETAASGPHDIEIRVINVRMNEEAARYHDLIGRYPTEVEVQRFVRSSTIRSGIAR